MEINIRALSSSENDSVYNSVAQLFSKMYAYMNTIGLNHKLTEGGEFLWIDTIKKSLGKLNMLVVATHEDMIVGFAAGNIRLLPNYLGSKKVGYISHVFVTDDHKKQKIGEKLVKELERCLIEKSVKNIELEVLVENKSALLFWEKMGFRLDNIRMIKGSE